MSLLHRIHTRHLEITDVVSLLRMLFYIEKM